MRSVLPLSRRPGLAWFRDMYYLPRIPMPVFMGHRGPVGRSVWPGKGCQTVGSCVVPKTTNLRNHLGANNNANSRWFLYKLELESKCT